MRDVLVPGEKQFMTTAMRLNSMVPLEENGGSGAMVEYFTKSFKGISPALLKELSKDLEVKLFLDGDRIMKEGEYGNCMYILEYGAVLVEMQGEKLARFGRGKVFGEMAVLGSLGASSAGHQLDSMRTATVSCVSMIAVVKVLFASAFHNLLENYPGEMSRFDQYYISRQTQNDLLEIRNGLQQLDDFYGVAYPLRDPIYTADSKKRSGGNTQKTKLFKVGEPRIADVLCTHEKQGLYNY